MNLKKQFSLIFAISFSALMTASEVMSYKLYGFVRNDLYVNSRQNIEALDGILNIFPRPIEMHQGADKNAQPNSQMIAISTRLGLDLKGKDFLNAKTSAKIECDFAGVGAQYFLIRLRQAYTKLNWEKTELLVGQTWHPLFNAAQPLTPSMSVGAPFQPFNRSPQIRLTQQLGQSFQFTTAAAYQMQFLTQGPSGASAWYMKNGLLPSLFSGIEYKNPRLNVGFAFDGKSLLIDRVRFSSGAAMVYTKYQNKKFQFAAKSILGQNMSEYIMLGGYGVSGERTYNQDYKLNTYSNFNTSSSWISAAYGSTFQMGFYAGLIQNLGTQKQLTPNNNGMFTVYGLGQNATNFVDRLLRFAPHAIYNFGNCRLSFEYEFTQALYGSVTASGRVSAPYAVSNHRLSTSFSYIF